MLNHNTDLNTNRTELLKALLTLSQESDNLLHDTVLFEEYETEYEILADLPNKAVLLARTIEEKDYWTAVDEFDELIDMKCDFYNLFVSPFKGRVAQVIACKDILREDIKERFEIYMTFRNEIDRLFDFIELLSDQLDIIFDQKEEQDDDDDEDDILGEIEIFNCLEIF